MASKSFRRLVDDDGQEYYFSCDKFNKAISTYLSKLQTQNNRKVNKTSIRKYLADELHLSPDSIKNWEVNKNGPSSLEDTKKLAELIQIDYHELLDTDKEYLQPSPTKEQDRKLV